jgi:alcohol dehydrogenase (NADP+)
MTMNVLGYAAQSAKDVLAHYRFVRRDPRADDMEVIRIKYIHWTFAKKQS